MNESALLGFQLFHNYFLILSKQSNLIGIKRFSVFNHLVLTVQVESKVNLFQKTRFQPVFNNNFQNKKQIYIVNFETYL